MNKRKILVSASGILILAIVIYIFNMDNPKSMNKKGQNADSEYVEVSVKSATLSDIAKKIKVTGRVIPKYTQDISLSVGGQLLPNGGRFKSGQSFKKGQRIAAIDISEIKASLISQKSNFVKLLASVIPDLNIDYPDIYPQWKKYLSDFDVERKLKTLPEVKHQKAKLFLSGRGVYSSYYAIMEVQSRRDKYESYAPFDGVLIEALVDEGTIVAPNKKIGVFISKDVFEIESAIPNSQIKYLKKDMSYTFTDEDNTMYDASLIRINDIVDEKTQSVKVFFEVKSNTLKAGTYLSAVMEGEVIADAIVVPDYVLVDDKHIFIVKNKKAQLQRVKIVYREDGNSILQELENGVQLIMDKKPLSFEATPVKIVLLK